jgi:hypothetical protein
LGSPVDENWFYTGEFVKHLFRNTIYFTCLFACLAARADRLDVELKAEVDRFAALTAEGAPPNMVLNIMADSQDPWVEARESKSVRARVETVDVHVDILKASSLFSVQLLDPEAGPSAEKQGTLYIRTPTPSAAKAFIFYLYSGRLPDSKLFGIGDLISLCVQHGNPKAPMLEDASACLSVAGNLISLASLQEMAAKQVSEVLTVLYDLRRDADIGRVYDRFLVHVVAICRDNSLSGRSYRGDLKASLVGAGRKDIEGELQGQIEHNKEATLLALSLAAIKVVEADERKKKKAVDAEEEKKRKEDEAERLRQNVVHTRAEKIAAKGLAALAAHVSKKPDRAADGVRISAHVPVDQNLVELKTSLGESVSQLGQQKIIVHIDRFAMSKEYEVACESKVGDIRYGGRSVDCNGDCTVRSCCSAMCSLTSLLLVPLQWLTCGFFYCCGTKKVDVATSPCYLQALADQGCYHAMNCCRVDISFSLNQDQLPEMAAEGKRALTRASEASEPKAP